MRMNLCKMHFCSIWYRSARDGKNKIFNSQLCWCRNRRLSAKFSYERHMGSLLRTVISTEVVLLHSERAIFVNRMFHVIMETMFTSRDLYDRNFTTELKWGCDEDSLRFVLVSFTTHIFASYMIILINPI